MYRKKKAVNWMEHYGLTVTADGRLVTTQPKAPPQNTPPKVKQQTKNDRLEKVCHFDETSGVRPKNHHSRDREDQEGPSRKKLEAQIRDLEMELGAKKEAFRLKEDRLLKEITAKEKSFLEELQCQEEVHREELEALKKQLEKLEAKNETLEIKEECLKQELQYQEEVHRGELEALKKQLEELEAKNEALGIKEECLKQELQCQEEVHRGELEALIEHYEEKLEVKNEIVRTTEDQMAANEKQFQNELEAQKKIYQRTG